MEVGDRVVALIDIYDEGPKKTQSFHHAKPGDFGTVEYLPSDTDKVVTVRFDSGSACDVSVDYEIQKL